jgi:cytochrome c oxidase assembly protein subunit 11
VQEKKNQRSFFKMASVAVMMFGFGYLLVPLYDIFCELTGLNGKTGVTTESEIAAQYQPDKNRLVTVQFVANNASDMPWDFKPLVTTMQVTPGQLTAAQFVASNTTHTIMTGQAVPSVSPTKASRYFNKTECFCFEKQSLAAGESKEMPLRFVVDPRLPDDVKTLTLAYTLFDVSNKTAAN